MLIQIKSLVHSYKQYSVENYKKTSLELILSSFNINDSQEKRLETIQMLFFWATPDYQEETERLPTYKLKYLIHYLKNNPSVHADFLAVFFKTLTELSCLDFFCEIGLPGQVSFIGELSDKIMNKVLPEKPINNQLGEFLLTLFPQKDNDIWIKNIDPDTLEQLFELFTDNNKLQYPKLKSDIEEALIYLISQIVAIGLSPLVRSRIPHRRLNDLPFFQMSSKLDLYLKFTKDGEQSKLKDQLYGELLELFKETDSCLIQAYKYMDHFGVSINLVYQLERLKFFLIRANTLLNLNYENKSDKKITVEFIADIINQSQKQKSIRSHVTENVTLLTQKIVEYNSLKGEHYIAQDSSGFSRMFNRAMGGGFVTAFTIYAKIILSSLSFTGFFGAMTSSLNYAGSFIFIHFAGFTLATKQPASTAPALAQKLEDLDKLDQIDKVTDEIVMMTRTQFVAVLGNILTVIPCVLIINLIYHTLTGSWVLNHQAADYILRSSDLLGPAFIYAGFTGFLLWLSGVTAGWAENWFAYNDLLNIISKNKKYRAILGTEGAQKLARFFEGNISGIAGGVSLGLLLGLTPEILKFLNIPLEVRHITLSTGALFTSLPVLGLKVTETFLFWRCLTGLLMIGIMNIAVSFAMAFFVAVRAKKISAKKRNLIYQAVLKRFLKNPLEFIFYKRGK